MNCLQSKNKTKKQTKTYISSNMQCSFVKQIKIVCLSVISFFIVQQIACKVQNKGILEGNNCLFCPMSTHCMNSSLPKQIVCSFVSVSLSLSLHIWSGLDVIKMVQAMTGPWWVCKVHFHKKTNLFVFVSVFVPSRLEGIVHYTMVPGHDTIVSWILLAMFFRSVTASLCEISPSGWLFTDSRMSPHLEWNKSRNRTHSLEMYRL